MIYKEGMVIKPREDGKPPEPPEGFNIFTNENGLMVLRRKRIRKIGMYIKILFQECPKSKVHFVFYDEPFELGT